MLCNVILTFVLVFSDGHKEAREKHVDESTAAILVERMKDPISIDPPECCTKIEGIVVKKVKEFKC